MAKDELGRHINTRDLLIYRLNPERIFIPVTGPVENCPKVGELYESPVDVVEVTAVVPETQRLSLVVVHQKKKPYDW